MTHFPLFFIKKLTAHDLGISKGVLFKRACYLSCQKEPIEKFFQNIQIGDLKEDDDALKFIYSYQLPYNLGLADITLSVRRYKSLVFELPIKKALAEKLQLKPDEIMVIEQLESEKFTIKIVQPSDENYEAINNALQNGKIQLTTSVSPL
jgi:hypothetical protein